MFHSDILHRARFTVTSNSDHQLLWKERGPCYAQQYVRERDRYGPGVLVWADIMNNGEEWNNVETMERGDVTLEKYCRRIILDHGRIFSTDFLFMEDVFCPNFDAEASNTLESEDINPMQWLEYLDLNPIEHACNNLRRRVS